MITKLTPIQEKSDKILKKCLNSYEGNDKNKERKEILNLYRYYFQYSSKIFDYIMKNEMYDKLKILKKIHNVIPIEKEVFVQLYDQKLVGHMDGRVIYESIRNLSPYNKCPYCGVGVVKTLDHYLPKTIYRILSLDPKNLIPMCRDCNTEKLTNFDFEKAYINPYYDNITDEIWLKCEIIFNKGNEYDFKYNIIKPNNYSQNKYYRIKKTFDDLKLDYLFSSNASDYFCEFHSKYYGHYCLSDIQLELDIEIKNLEVNKLNSWKVALLRALRDNKIYFETKEI